MKPKVLVLGHTGKMGVALMEVLRNDYSLSGKNSKDFDATDFAAVDQLLAANRPDIVINTVAFLGIDPCEQDPSMALTLNTLYPRCLAQLSHKYGFLLVHFSTDAVFNDDKGDFYTENDLPCPLNLYGFTKYGGDCFVQNIAERYYIIRISVLFGKTNKDTQFVEKMLQRVTQGQTRLRIADDITLSPSYTFDIAQKIKQLLDNRAPYGLYNVANDGKASLYELFKEITDNLDLQITVEPTSHTEFPAIGMKNTFTPIRSVKVQSLRPWREAVKDYCGCIKDRVKGE